MSRIGNKPIPIPIGVKLEISNDLVKVTGAKGTLEQKILPEIELVKDDEILLYQAHRNLHWQYIQ